MDPVQLVVARIGNSRGVRIPAATLKRFRIGDRVSMEEREDGILLRPIRAPGLKLSWEATALAMALEDEDWSDWDVSLADGMEQLDWEEPAVKQVAEQPAKYVAQRPKVRRSRK